MEKFSIGDLVMHFREGLSRISKEIKMNEIAYFVVESCRQGGEIIYVPIAKADQVIRHIISVKQAEELLVYIKEIQPEYITNTKQRRDSFKRRLGSGDIKDLAFLSRQLYFFLHPEVVAVPVKFGPADVEMLKYASRTMYDELAISYGKDREVIEEFIVAKLA